MDLFRLFGVIAINNKEANDGIDETTAKAEGAHPKIASAFGKIGSAALAVGTTIAAGVAAGAAAIGKLAKASLDGYADYEQLVGGVETLFGAGGKSIEEYAETVGQTVAEVSTEYEALMQAQEDVLKNASEAYKSAGLSTNEYMETVTSFSASLISSLDGDTAKAAAVADRAIRDMSDNANKMGTDISMIQNAYQGFAKQNYTMLDNLKLGYGGTKEEMARLIEHANELKEANGEMADLSIDSYADVVEAIGLVQDEMGITGTTALEASKTISGSVSAMKASWKNLVTGIANENANLSGLIDSFVESALTAIDNIVPRLQEIFSGIGEVVGELAPIIGEQIPILLESLLPGLIEGGVALLNSLVEVLPDLLDSVLPSLVDGFILITTTLLTTALPQIIQVLIDQLPFILEQIGTALVTLFPVLLETVKSLFGQIFDYISLELLGTNLSFEETFAAIQTVVEGAWTVLQTLWNTIGQPIWDVVQHCIGSVKETFESRMPEIEAFVSSCFTDIETFWNNNLKPCLEAIGNFIENVLAPAFEYVFDTVIGPVVDGVFNYIKDIWNNTLKPVFTGITDFLTGVFTGNWEQAWDGIVGIADGIFSGLVSVVKAPINTCIGIINNFISGLNNLSVPDWVPAVGGKSINIPLIPMLAEGGVLEKGQVGFLEGNGAEAVVPLDQNKAWIRAVADDMQFAFGGTDAVKVLEQILAALLSLDDGMHDKLTDAFATMKFDVNNREFARMVKAVN